MKKFSLVVGLLLIASIFVCGMSRPSKKAPVQKQEPKAVVPVLPAASSIPPQMRGYVLENLPKSMAEVVNAMDSVDVLLTFSAEMKEGKRQKVTVTLLQTVKVLKVGIDGDKAYLMLALSPRDAQYVALGQEEGNLSVILRAPGDMTQYHIEIASLGKLFN